MMTREEKNRLWSKQYLEVYPLRPQFYAKFLKDCVKISSKNYPDPTILFFDTSDFRTQFLDIIGKFKTRE